MGNSKWEESDRAEPNYSDDGTSQKDDFNDTGEHSSYSSDRGGFELQEDAGDNQPLASQDFRDNQLLEDDYNQTPVEPNVSSLGDQRDLYNDQEQNFAPEPNYSPESRQPAGSGDERDDDEHDDERRSDGRPEPADFEDWGDFSEAMVDWKASQGNMDQLLQDRVNENLQGLADLGLDPMGDNDPDFKNLIALKKQAEKSVAENRPGSSEQRDAQGRVKYLGEMIQEKMEKYEGMAQAPGKRAAGARIKAAATEAIQDAVAGRLHPSDPKFKTAINAHNSIEGGRSKVEAFFADVLGEEDRMSFPNARAGTIVFLTFPESYDGDPVSDAKAHGHIRSDGSVDLTTWAISNGGTVYRKGVSGKLETVEARM